MDPPDLHHCPVCVVAPQETERPLEPIWHYQVVRGCEWHSAAFDQALLPDRRTALSRMRDRVDPWTPPQ